MRKKALAKDTLREMKKSLGRFISIFAIVGIGVAFFAGVKASVPVMKKSADTYFDEYNLMDLKVMTTIGVTKDDVEELRKVSGVEAVYPSYSQDVVSVKNNTQKVFKIMSMPKNTAATNAEYMNQVRVVKGRLPLKEDECVVEYSKLRGYSGVVGDTITFESGTDDKIEASLKHKTFKVVGEVTTPYYLSFEKGASSIGSGKVDNYAFILDSNFKSKYYSEAYVTIQGAKDLDSYSDAYFDKVKPIENNIKNLEKELARQRFADIKKEAQKTIDDGRKELTNQKKKYEDGIAEGKQKLVASQQTLKDAQKQLDTRIKNTNALFKEKEAQLEQNKKQLQEVETKTIPYLKAQLTTIQNKKPEAEAGYIQLQKGLKEINKNLANINDALQNPQLDEETKTALMAQKQTLLKKQKELTSSIKEVEKQITELTKNEKLLMTQIPSLEAKVKLGKPQITSGERQLKDGKAKAMDGFKAAQTKITNGLKEIEKGKTELYKQERDGKYELDKAEANLKKGETDVKNLKSPTIYTLDRNSHYSYMDYGSAADRMGAISQVFPLFFFLVAALVCLTTMTRMVDEQRQEIGTLKALGYTKPAIAMKYVSYAGFASVFGGIFGAIVGMTLFPTVIYNAWGIMYNMPGVHLDAQIPLAITAIALSCSITIAAAVMAVYKELIETPALLMRPKAPKNGKKILLERIPFLWKHFNFIHKVTARNIFRYKKRFLMTVIGISGCTALLVAGFGIRDSIGEIAQKQYGDIYQFDVSMTYHAKSPLSEKEKVLADLKKEKSIKAVTEVGIYHGFYQGEKEDKGVDLYVVKDQKQIDGFISLHNRTSKEEYKLDDAGVIITEKLARLKDVSVGDSIAINNGSGTKQEVKIKGIMETYVGHSIYMTSNYYQKTFHETSENTGVLAKMKQNDMDNETRLGNSYMQREAIDSVSFYSGIAKSFQETIASLSFVVVVLIISAGCLAFVVLYNLTNVNISERLREIATIKVLGFYDREVSSYVYRENIVLTLIGAFAGLLLGIALHRLIMNIAEMETIMFGRNIAWLSFLYSLGITMLFSIIVNLVMYRKLKRIPMVESLKSVE